MKKSENRIEVRLMPGQLNGFIGKAEKGNLNCVVLWLMLFFFISVQSQAEVQASDKKNQLKNDSIKPGEIWPDENGNHIQAHGGGIIKIKNTYYWYGEQRGQGLDTTYRYVSCYSSKSDQKKPRSSLRVICGTPRH